MDLTISQEEIRLGLS